MVFSPVTVMAFSRFQPRTAPRPARPVLCLSARRDANFTRCSPAGPIHTDPKGCFPWFFCSCSLQAPVPRPHKSAASWKITPSADICSHFGRSHLPFRTNASYPARFRYKPKLPPQLENAGKLSLGDSEATSNRAAPGAPVPVRSDDATTTIFSSDRAASLPVIRSVIICAASDFPLSSRVRYCTGREILDPRCCVRSISKMLPA